ncbi:hypothetical protein L5M43_22610 [Shewanella sp. SW36]|uniref:hypothetical protein n=1 Tax=unclassified Shewanella TaxID=196818 RepID=UPI0021D92081|nr:MULTISPECIES: hypothetical protein [unclassified Shewanella]MCU7978005.1 hypothetical protein [Shewanella sp. SW36]MCU7993247.1 hypothetical protein [Shewanella sp. SW1]MCU8019157.1 hypothetical protein [Shewanella sp. SM72]MCU8054532.1 hypothetical protein [Shewanella sp. SM43]
MSTINPNSYTNTFAKSYANVPLKQVEPSTNGLGNRANSMTEANLTSSISQDTVTLSSAASVTTADTYSHLAPNAKQGYTGNVQAIAGTPETDKSINRLDKAMQAILDNRTGVDRDKINKIDEEMAKVAADENLSEEQKAKQLELLQAQKLDLIKESSEKNEERQRRIEPEVYYS